MKEKLTNQQGGILLRLAIETIEEELGRKKFKHDQSDFKRSLKKSVFREKRGVFVTLHKNRQLRGCIGTLDSSETIKKCVMDNAVNAAFHDPRFTPLKKKELDSIDIEVSILTTPQKLEYSNGDDLLNKIRPDIDGIIIKKGWKKATFLPQVWEQLKEPEEFLSHLCRKAGLAKNEWGRGELEVMTYQVQYFKENR